MIIIIIAIATLILIAGIHDIICWPVRKAIKMKKKRGAHKEKLFKPNEQFSNPGTAKEKGTGLGLILCKEFVEKNHGKIWVDSKPGSGSCFHFILPNEFSQAQ